VTGDPELTEAIKRDYSSAGISETDRTMLDYVVKLTREPWNVESTDVDQLRSVGFDERGILDICQVAAYYAFVNRLADGLGVELEDYWRESGTD
jgi:uncharacterized peroxidase-related enzyme